VSVRPSRRISVCPSSTNALGPAGWPGAGCPGSITSRPSPTDFTTPRAMPRGTRAGACTAAGTGRAGTGADDCAKAAGAASARPATTSATRASKERIGHLHV
jgi:hypothetical protein